MRPKPARKLLVNDRAERKSEFLLTTQLGSGHSDGAFCNMIAESTARIGAKEYTAHGLRKNAAIALAEAGCTVHQIMAITELGSRPCTTPSGRLRSNLRNRP